MESKQVVQFAELVRQAIPGDERVMVWLGDEQQVARGAMPAAVLANVFPACFAEQPHLVQNLGNWDQYVCLVCGFRHSKQLKSEVR